MGVGVNHADAAAHKLLRIEAGNQRAEGLLVAPQHVAKGMVDIQNGSVVRSNANRQRHIVQGHPHPRIGLSGFGSLFKRGLYAVNRLADARLVAWQAFDRHVQMTF